MQAHAFTSLQDKGRNLSQGEILETYGKYDKLDGPSAESDPSSLTLGPPSVIQVSTLMLVASIHQPNYNLYEYNCYWYADTIFEACKNLFPLGREECKKHGDRGRCNK